MTKILKLLLVLTLTITIISIFLVAILVKNKWDTDTYQHDADITRMNHIVEIGEHLDEYKEKTGGYPFTNTSDLPIYIFIGKDSQIPKETESSKYIEVDQSELIAELETILEKEIKLPSNPQLTGGESRPLFYLYTMDGSHYTLTAYLHGFYPFSEPLGDSYSRLVLSNTLEAWQYHELIEHYPFIKAKNKEMYKGDYLKYLKDKY